MGQMPFLSPNQQYQGIKETQRTKPAAWPHLFLCIT